MNSFLLSVGVAIVLALFAALIGPFFVDWNGYRGMFEARLTEIAGRPVSVGHVDEFRILPMPVFRASDVSIGSSIGLREGGEERDQPFLSAPRVTARMALTPLLSGEFRIEDVRIDEPVLSLTLDADGRAMLPQRPGDEAMDPERVSLNGLDIRDGTLVLHDSAAGTTRRLSGINLSGQATTLAGPFRAEGGFVAGETLYNFRLGTGRVAGEAMRAKLTLNPAGGNYTLAFDGQAAVREGRPSFFGEVSVAHAPPPPGAVGESALRNEIALPWRINGALSLDPDAVLLEKLILGIGPETREVQLTGDAAMPLEPGARLAVRLNTRQMDLDRALGGQPGATVALDDAVSGLPGLMEAAGKLAVPVDLALDADAVLVNGALVEQARLDAALEEGVLDVADLSALLPGNARAQWAGAVRLDNGHAAAAGDVSLNVRQAGRLAEWLGRGGAAFGPVRIRADDSALALKAHLEVSGKEVALSGLEARLDDALVTGDVGYRREPDRALRLALKADMLDLDRYVQTVPAPADEGGGEQEPQAGGLPDIAVDIEAGEVRMSGIAMRGLDADFTYEEGDLAISRLRIGDAGGASLEASGRIEDLLGQADGEMTAALSAQALDGLVALADELGILGAAGEAAAPRAATLSPVRAEFTVRAARTGTGSDMSARLTGRFGGTGLAASADFAGTLAGWRDGDVSITLDGENASSRRLLAQLAGRDIAMDGGGNGDGPGRVNVRLKGVPRDGAAFAADAALFDVEASAEGTLTLADETGFEGAARLDAGSARALSALFDLPAGAEALAAPVRAEAAIAGAGPSWRAEGITGAAGGGGFDGDLDLTWPKGERPTVSARLGLDQLDLAWMLALLLGEDTRLGTDEGWPRAPFAMRVPGGADASVALDIKRLDLPAGAAASDARLAIGTAPGRVAIRDATAKLFGGDVKLDATFRGGAAGVSASANMTLDSATARRMAWAPGGGQTVATGTVDLSAQVNGSGRSWLGLVSSLDGDGRFVARDGVMRGLSPEAFAKTLDAASAGLEIAEPSVAEAFSAYLAAEPLAYERFEGEFTIEDGLVSARNIALDSPGANARVSALIDIPGRRIDSEWLVSPVDETGTQEQVPPVALVFAGPLTAPERTLDVHALTGFLTVRRLEADLERLEDAQADALEREFFDRRLDIIRHAHMERVREERERARAEAEARELERLRREAEERARQALEDAEVRRQQEQVDGQGSPTGRDEAPRDASDAPDTGALADRDDRLDEEDREDLPAGRQKDDEETASSDAADEAGEQTPAQADRRRREALRRLIEEALGEDPSGRGEAPREGGASGRGEIVREELPPVPRASVPDTDGGGQPAPGRRDGQREASASGQDGDEPVPDQAVPAVPTEPVPPQRSIELQYDPVGVNQ